MSHHPPRCQFCRRCARVFEKSRLELQFVSDAYQLVLPLLRHPLDQRRGTPAQPTGLGGGARATCYRALGG